MKRHRLLSLLIVPALMTVAGAYPVPAGGTRGFGAENGRYQIGEPITIRFENNTDHDVRIGKIWRIGVWQTDQDVASYYWPDAQRTVAPGDERVWTWHQLGSACYGECQNVSPGEQVNAGRYVVFAPIGGRQRQDTFLIGSYFTLGFESRDNVTFVVYVARQRPIERMTAEAESEDKTLIVGGIIRRGRAPYNNDWSYTMGPRSIRLGEVWIEVCDAAPGYVERHLDDWAGDMWCPWSSYVARAGF